MFKLSYLRIYENIQPCEHIVRPLPGPWKGPRQVRCPKAYHKLHRKSSSVPLNPFVGSPAAEWRLNPGPQVKALHDLLYLPPPGQALADCHFFSPSLWVPFLRRHPELHFLPPPLLKWMLWWDPCTDQGSFSPSGQVCWSLVDGSWIITLLDMPSVRGLPSPGSCPFPGDSNSQWLIKFGNNSERPAQPSPGLLVSAGPHVMTTWLFNVSLSCRCWSTLSPGKSLPVDLCLRVDFQGSCAAFSMPKSSPGIPPGSYLSGRPFLDSLLLSTCLHGGHLSSSFLTQ